MTLKCQILKDAEILDQKPLLELCQWLREYGADAFYMRYENDDTHTAILDFGDLRCDLESWFNPEMGGSGADCPNPPDIREWLDSQMGLGNYLAWVNW